MYYYFVVSSVDVYNLFAKSQSIVLKSPIIVHTDELLFHTTNCPWMTNYWWPDLCNVLAMLWSPASHIAVMQAVFLSCQQRIYILLVEFHVS